MPAFSETSQRDCTCNCTDGADGPPGPRGPPGVCGGVTYIRWGRTSCPTTGTTLLYNGTAAKSFSDETGGGGNYQCLPNYPEYGRYAREVQGASPIHGVEYEIDTGSPFPPAHHDDNVPCAVCQASNRSHVLMIPAWRHCPSGWTLEYTGYLMSEHINGTKSTYECVDENAELIPGSQADTDGGLFSHVEATDNGIPCPPYNSQKELTCVVCTY